MNSTKTLGTLALFGGFLASAYVVVAQAESIDWTHYSITAGLMLVGLVLTRIGSADKGDGEGKHTADLDVLTASLAELKRSVAGYQRIEADEDLLGLHARIDEELVENLGSFVDARESMIARFGLATYAEVMSAFAIGERLINRAWSASADGYVDEVRTCVNRALKQFETAESLLAAARA